MTITEYLDEIQKRADGASLGPYSGLLRRCISGEGIEGFSKDDAAFLSNASTDIPTLLKITRRLLEASQVMCRCGDYEGDHSNCATSDALRDVAAMIPTKE